MNIRETAIRNSNRPKKYNYLFQLHILSFYLLVETNHCFVDVQLSNKFKHFGQFVMEFWLCERHTVSTVAHKLLQAKKIFFQGTFTVKIHELLSLLPEGTVCGGQCRNIQAQYVKFITRDVQC